MDDDLFRIPAAYDRTEKLALSDGESGLAADMIRLAQRGYFVMVFAVLEVRIDLVFSQRVGDWAKQKPLNIRRFATEASRVIEALR